MIDVDIPGFTRLLIDKLVFDYNGTLACDGIPISGVKVKLNQLAKVCKLYIITADTFGTVKEEFADVEAEIVIIDSYDGTGFKKEFVKKLGNESVIAIGNGNNDALMLDEAKLGILIIGYEGASIRSLLKSDIIVNNISDALNILLKPERLKATLRQ
jgi:soluble P-type ATPase